LEAASTVLLVFGLLAFFLAYVNRPSSALRYLLDASYWVYLVHMPLVCVLPGLLGPDAWWTGTKFAAVLVLTYGLSLASYAWFVRGKALGRFLGERAGS
jgi:peptidoglycan/LPS O-acetylase OafA/YrhL